MSVNLHLSFEIHNIKDIHYMDDDTKRDEIIAAAKKFLTDENLYDQDMMIDFIGQEGYLAGYTSGPPVIISKADAWIPDVTKRWEEMAKSVLGESCQPKLVVENVDGN
ncbi:MAG: hypothetical protein K0S32_3939 [Bacteroidetes bacterium]|jgi:hypothetical protein|nr:hypothetical protein [Bacteroidota bacterium]